MAIKLDRPAAPRKKESFFGQAHELSDILLRPARNALKHAGSRRAYVMSTQHIARLRFDQWLAVQNAVAVEESPTRLHEILKSQIERTVEIPQIGTLQALECLERIAHVSFNPVMASVSLKISGGMPAKEILRVAATYRGRNPVQRVRARAIARGGKS
jgi:hypothetical protein